LIGALSVAWRGRKLSEDTEYQRRLASGALKSPEPSPAVHGKELFNARGSTLLFLVGISLVALIGMFPRLRLVYETVEGGAAQTDQVSMGMAIMIVMIAIAGLTMILFRASPETTLKGTIMRNGVVAIISIMEFPGWVLPSSREIALSSLIASPI
jgi:anaerobic C4-dicarboxylate transporter